MGSLRLSLCFNCLFAAALISPLGFPEGRFFARPRVDLFRPSLLSFAGILPSSQKNIVVYTSTLKYPKPFAVSIFIANRSPACFLNEWPQGTRGKWQGR